MHRLIMAVVVVGSLVVTLAGLAAAQGGTGTLGLSDGSWPAGIGFSWGKGTSTYEGVVSEYSAEPVPGTGAGMWHGRIGL